MISADAKKRELVGNFKHAGARWDRTPTPVNDHDFRSQSDGIAILYGIYDLHANRGAMFVGVSHETSAFAVASIRTWWQWEGSQRYPGEEHLLILADTGGGNSATRGAWKDQLQRFCDHSGLSITVAHYHTGASKYNPIERRLFSMISKNWAGEPLRSYEKILKSSAPQSPIQGSKCVPIWIASTTPPAQSRLQTGCPSYASHDTKWLPNRTTPSSPHIPSNVK